VRVVFADPALDDLRRLGARGARRALACLPAVESGEEPGVTLATADTAYRRIAWGAGGRIVFAVDDGTATVWEVWADGLRTNGAAYAEALDRMVAADAPDAVELAGILERLGRLTGTVPAARGRGGEPVPDWLADALLRHTPLSRLDVAAMDAATAFDAWNSHRTA
jgi:mRNA interferase RelE/StbE